jgi:hypothetical protein
MMDSIFSAIFAVIGAVVFFIFVSFLLSWPVYMLWNGCLVGAVSGVHEVTWLQGWGISILCNILFKNTTKVKK